MAEGSLSTGSTVAPWVSAMDIIISPAMMMTSLFDRAMAFPCSSARIVGTSPALPMVAAMISSASGRQTISSMGMIAALSGSRARSSSRAHQANRGLNSSTWDLSKSRLRPAASPMTSNSSGKALTTSRVCRPMDPVEPNTISPLIWSPPMAFAEGLPSCGGFENERNKIIHHGYSQNNRVQPVENPAVAGQQAPSVFNFADALYLGLN